jgi:activator of HSP90 ATPase
MLQHSSSSSLPYCYSPTTSTTTPGLSSLSRLRASSLHENETETENESNTTLAADQVRTNKKKRVMSVATASLYVNKARTAMKENDQMVYLEGPQIYSCAHCRTHLTSHDDIVSKSFHGRHGTYD